MKACANCLRKQVDGVWLAEKITDDDILVKPYLKVKYEVCPECSKMRAGEMVTVCCNCLKLRNDAGEYVDCDFDNSYKRGYHGICPDCMQKLYPDLCA